MGGCQYCFGDPINQADSTGLFTIPTVPTPWKALWWSLRITKAFTGVWFKAGNRSPILAPKCRVPAS